MTSYDEKKTLPPAEVLPGGVFPDEIAALKKKIRGEKLSRLKIAIAVGSVVLVILAVVGGIFLGLHLRRKPTVVKRSVQLLLEGEILKETIEVDKERETETFRTVHSNGTSFVMRDMKKGLSAYKFDGDDKCYVLLENLEGSEDTKELSDDLEEFNEEGDVDIAQLRAEMFLTVDEDRGQVKRSVLSESMVRFCGARQSHWALMSSSEPSPTPVADVAEEGESKSQPTATVEEEASTMAEEDELAGTKGTGDVHPREKRSYWDEPGCRWEEKEVCYRRCESVCVLRFRSYCCRWGRVCRWECRWVRYMVCGPEPL